MRFDFLGGLLEGVRAHVHITFAQISEILIRNQLAPIKDKLQCH